MQIEVRPTLISNTRTGDKSSIDLVWLAQLLKNIGQGDSLVAASKKSGISYRGSWGKLNDVEKALSIPLLIRTRGHGSKLTSFGEFLIYFIDGMKSEYGVHGRNYQDALVK